jgi:phospholipid/cholesterol/gamma-HCH transport system substrate-binding protein
MTRRVVLNISVFLLIGLVLGYWAALNVLDLPVITHPYDITAEFASSPGLHPHFQVAYLGVKVGQIKAVDLEPGQARVTLEIGHGVKLPVGVLAAASRESPIGEPYVALSPPRGYVNGGPYLRRGYVIGLADTSVPLSYEDVFQALDRLAAAIPPQALDTLLHELALSLDGRADTLRQLLANTDSLTTTLAQHADQIDQLIGDLTTLTQTLAANRGAIGTSLDNLDAIAATLAQQRSSIDALLGQAPDFAAEVTQIVDQSSGQLGCLLDGLGSVSDVLGSPAQITALEQVLQTAPQLIPLIPKIEATTPAGDMLKGFGRFNVNGSAVPVYPTPSTLPPVPKVPQCTAAGAVAAAPAPPAGVSGTSQGAASAGPITVPVSQPVRRPVAIGPSSTEATHGRHVPKGPLELLAAALLVILVVLLARPWRLLVR